VITIISVLSDISFLFLSNKEMNLGKLKKIRKDEEILKKNDEIMKLRLKLMREHAQTSGAELKRPT
jgi:ferredoxin-fold anticodon binding domain-containing protein